jgi:hypothetical protein
MGTSCDGCALAISHICCDAAFLVLSLLPVKPHNQGDAESAAKVASLLLKGD